MRSLLIGIALVCALQIKSAKANSGDFSGAVAVGSSYANSVTAPSNGLAVQGPVTIGTASQSGSSALTVSGNGNITTLQLNTTEIPFPAGGTLALTSSGQFFPADVSSATTVLYLPTQAGETVPIFNGTHWQSYDIGSGGLALSMSASANFPSGEIFDVYAVNNSGTPTLCAIYWGGAARSSTAGGKSGSQDVTLKQVNGIYTNNSAFATGNCFNNNTSYTPAAKQATYLGSFHTSGAGQTRWICHPAPASGGGAVDMAVYNVFNQKAYSCMNIDNGPAYTYTVVSPRVQRNSAANEMHWLDGLGYSTSLFIPSTDYVSSTSSNCGFLGAAFNSTSVPFGQFAQVSCGLTNYVSTSASASAPGAVGYNYFAPLESSDYSTGTVTWNSSSSTGGYTNAGNTSDTLTINGM